MVNDLVQGMAHFSENFEDYKDDYIIIGGIATAINQRRFGFASKATKDFDLIVLDESEESAFVSHFVDYVRNKAKYRFIGKFKDEARVLYQFKDPANRNAPEMIELFTINELDESKLTFERLRGKEYFEYISAIVLNKEYRKLIETYRLESSNLSIAGPEVLIPLKALAFVNFTKIDDKIDKKQIKRNAKEAKKHLDDIKSLCNFIEDDEIIVSASILENIEIVSDKIKLIKGKEEIAAMLKEVYKIQ